MNEDQAIKLEVTQKHIFFVLGLIDQSLVLFLQTETSLSEKLLRQSYLNLIFGYAQQVLPLAQINAISKNNPQSPADQLDELRTALIKLLDQLPGASNMPGASVMEEYTAYQEKKKKDDQPKPVPVATKLTPQQQVQQAIAQLSQQLRDSNQNQLADNLLQHQTEAADSLVADPTLLGPIAKIISDATKTDLNEIILQLTDVAAVIIPAHLPSHNLQITLLAQTQSSEQVAQILTTFSLISKSTPETITTFLNRIKVRLEADHLPKLEFEQFSGLLTTISEWNFHPTASQLHTQTLFAQLISHTQLSVPEAHQAVTQLTVLTPFIHSVATGKSRPELLTQVGSQAIHFVFQQLGLRSHLDAASQAKFWSPISRVMDQLYGNAATFPQTQYIQDHPKVRAFIIFLAENAPNTPQIKNLLSNLNSSLPAETVSARQQITPPIPAQATTPRTQIENRVLTSLAEHKQEAGAVAIGGLVGTIAFLFGVGLSQILALGGLTTITTYSISKMGGRTFASKASSTVNRASYALQATVTAAGAGCAGCFTVVVITMISIPIFIALILFIINNSAYVIPLSTIGLTGGVGGGTQPPGPGIEAVGTCPVFNASTGCGSFHSPTARSCHGTNGYWAGLGFQCKYGIPLDSPNTLNGGRCLFNTYQGESVCYRANSTCSTYGYAADVPPVGNDSVYLPQLANDSGQIINRAWTRVSQLFTIKGGSWGYGTFYRTSDGLSPSYEMYFGHLAAGSAASANGISGQPIGRLHRGTGFGTHLHIEIKQNGVDIIPDPLCQGN